MILPLFHLLQVATFNIALRTGRMACAGATLVLVLCVWLPCAARADELVIEADGVRHVFQIELADEPAERERGLMFRNKLAPDAGMLFDFGRSEPVYMWMKNTYIPLDMLFIDTAGMVRRIEENTEPFSLKTIASGGQVRYVLELPGGTAGRLGLKPGAQVRHPAIPGS